MNILFLSLGEFENLNAGSVHIDLMKRFAKDHSVYLICKRERKVGKPTELSVEYGINVLHIRTGNIKNTNLIEKGISTIMVETQFKAAIKEYFSSIKFDLALYTTPPVTFERAVAYVKKRDGAKTYLLLKDIFPQNAVDIGLMCTNGLKGLLYKHFRRQEKRLYAISDCIGCMSQANVDYVIKHNPEVDPTKVEICPNCIEVIDKSVDEQTRVSIRNQYGIPLDKKVFVYGGNLGKPQGIPFIIECLKKCRDMEDVFFLIVGDGTEYHVLEEYAQTSGQANFKLMKGLPKEDYDTMVGACDVGMVFLDHRFTIPNFPSRLLSYMQAKIPVLACTDPNTDIGKVIVDGGFGWWCESNNVDWFNQQIDLINRNDCLVKGQKAFQYLIKHYSVGKEYEKIIRFMK